MERFVLTTQRWLSDAELERLQMQFTRWQRRGGLLVLSSDVTLTPFPPLPRSIHEGVSDEQLSWADEVLP